jgi:parallel beta-helix repeat protein
VALLCSCPTLGAVYYVSNDTGSDAFDGLSPATAFQTVGHINGLSLVPGDEVRFLCGETWRVQTLVITRSGSPGNPIVISSHPADCADKPVLSGAQPLSGWSYLGSHLYRADLDTGANAGLFPLGLNQLFRGPDRLPLGRWPNIAGHPDGGYAEVDSQPSSNQIRDTALPTGDWTGAVMHIKGIRWYMLNREVTGDSGSTLTLGADVQCWGGNCSQWGYFLNSHLDTLDQEGEWFYDEATTRVYLYSELGPPNDGEVEGSAITTMDGLLWGAILLGRNLQEHISHVTVENLRIERWFDAGITTPINLESDENSYLTIRNNDIADVETTGIRLTTWVWDAAAHGSGPNGWRGGRHQLIEGNTIDGANHFGLDTYAVDTQVLSNEIRNVALIDNLGRSGMGCGYSGTNCTENGAGIRVKHSSSAPDHTSCDNILRYNRIAKVGMNGIDLFGRNTTLENNVIDQACWSKGDCGGIRTFGRDNLATTPVHDVVIRGNIIRDTLGNTDGTHPDFETLFSLGIYLDNYSRDMIVEGNTVTGSTWVGALFQRSSGTFTGNTLYDNVASDWGSELSIVQSPTSVSQSGNIMFPLGINRRSLRVSDSSYLTASDNNYFMSPYYDTSVADSSAGCCDMALAGWQSWSGIDGASVAHWYTLNSTDPPRSEIFINDTGSPMIFNLSGKGYLDLDQQPVTGTLTLGAYSSQILIEDPSTIFVDGFESGDTSAWSRTQP